MAAFNYNTAGPRINGNTGKGRPRILVPEKISGDGLALLADYDVDVKIGLSGEQLLKEIPEYSGLIVRSETRVSAEVLRAGKNLKVVARAGVGVDNIDVNAASSLGIIVVNSPSGNITAAAGMSFSRVAHSSIRNS